MLPVNQMSMSGNKLWGVVRRVRGWKGTVSTATFSEAGLYRDLRDLASQKKCF